MSLLIARASLVHPALLLQKENNSEYGVVWFLYYRTPHNGQWGALVGVSHGRASIRLWFSFSSHHTHLSVYSS